MPSILFVCTANQFRSPIAAASFAQKLSAAGSCDTWKISSAGTWTSSGLPAHPEAIKSAAKIGLDLNNHQTLEVNADIIAQHDLIVVMESNHKESIELEFPAARGKIVLLGQMAKIPEKEISDPAKSNFSNADQVALTIHTLIQRTFPKLVQYAMLFHDGYSPLDE